MDLSLLMKLAHILSVLWLVTGIAGRNVVMAIAAKRADLAGMRALVDAGHQFDLRMVRPASFTVLGFGLATAGMQGLPLLGALRGRSPSWVMVSLLLFLSVFILIPTVFVPRGKVFRQALDDAIGADRVTPALRAAFADRAVAAGHAYEMVGIALITALMVLKPF